MDLEKARDQEISFTELSSLAQIDDSPMLLLGKQKPEMPKLTSEEPILLLMIADSGLSLFSKAFTKNDTSSEIDEQLLSGFLSAINNFSDRVFSRNLNRARLGEFNLVMQPVDGKVMMCYIFKGSTYLALQKIGKFINSVQENAFLWTQLTKTINDGITLKLYEMQKIDELVSTIFLS